MDSTPLDFEILYVYDEPYDFRVVFAKKLSAESLSSLSSNLKVSMSRLNSTEFKYTLQNQTFEQH